MFFDELPLADEVLDALWDMHFDECTPVQEHTIPVILEGRDVISCAQTGTGKTEDMVGHKLGEFAPTRIFKAHGGIGKK